MTWTDPRRLARACGVALPGVFAYLALGAAVLFTSFILLKGGVATRLPWLWDVQRHIYFTGARNIWPAQPACAEFDEELVYRPRLGRCYFDNPEFRTVQTFSADGRVTGPKPPGVGIAVLGDSQAMGWGVNDEETFAAELQRLSGRPVYNLAVSSYGTARELVRLERSGVLDRIDTVVIQYCQNDLEENLAYRPMTEDEARLKYQRLTRAASGRKGTFGSLTYLYDGYVFALRLPLSKPRDWITGRPLLDFDSHYTPLMATIARHGALRHARILVFYINSYGVRFAGFPAGNDPRQSNVEFVELALDRGDFYRVDDHLTRQGHANVARQLLRILRARPRFVTAAPVPPIR